MSKFQRWVAWWLVRKLVREPLVWEGKVAELFEIVNQRYREVFNEDNYFTRKAYLEEVLEKSTKITY